MFYHPKIFMLHGVDQGRYGREFPIYLNITVIFLKLDETKISLFFYFVFTIIPTMREEILPESGESLLRKATAMTEPTIMIP